MRSRRWVREPKLFDVDVYVHMGETELYIEVAMGDNPREIDHVEQHLPDADTVWIICRDQTVRDGLRERLAEHDLLQEPISLRLVNDVSELQHTRLP